MLLDGRGVKPEGFEDGNFLGPTVVTFLVCVPLRLSLFIMHTRVDHLSWFPFVITTISNLPSLPQRF